MFKKKTTVKDLSYKTKKTSDFEVSCLQLRLVLNEFATDFILFPHIKDQNLFTHISEKLLNRFFISTQFFQRILILRQAKKKSLT